MTKTNKTNFRVLAIAPSTGGFGFAVVEGDALLIESGIKTTARLKTTAKDKNHRSLKRVENLIAQFQPDKLVLEDTLAKDSRRSKRIRTLTANLIGMAKKCKLKVKLYSRNRVLKTFFPYGDGTKHAVAELIAQRFPDQLASKLPPKRKPWMSEHKNMPIFDAVALALMLRS